MDNWERAWDTVIGLGSKIGVTRPPSLSNTHQAQSLVRRVKPADGGSVDNRSPSFRTRDLNAPPTPPKASAGLVF